MSDFWIMQWTKMRQEEMEKETYLRRMARQAQEDGRFAPRGKSPSLGNLFYHLGKKIEACGQRLQRRFAPEPARTCCKC